MLRLIMKPLLKNKQRRSTLLLVAILYIFNDCCFAEQITPDSEQPLKIESSFVEFDDQKGIATYTGNVIANQGSRHLTADKLTIYRGENNKIDVMIAIGEPAHFQSQPDLQKPMGFGTANTIKYFTKEDKVDLIGNAKLEQDGDIVEGHFLIYFFQSGLLKSEPSIHQRTTVTLKPKDKHI